MNDLYQQLAYSTERNPDKPFMVEAETGRQLSYGQCFSAVQELRRLFGPPPRNIIALLPGGISDALLWITALTGGYLLFPLAPDSTFEEWDRATSMFKPDMLFLEQQHQARQFPRSETARVLSWQECQDLAHNAPRAPSRKMQPAVGAVCLMTSGTTGTPKGVVLDTPKIAWTADHIRTSHKLTASDVGLTPLPFFHINGPVVSLCSSLMAGSTVVLARKFSRHQFWSWVENHGVTWASIVPAIVAMLEGTDKPAFLPGKLRFVRTGSAAVPVNDMRTFEAKFGVPVVETYGLTEAASQIVANPVPPGRRKPGSAGIPVGISLRVCRRRVRGDTGLHDVPRGESGEICISGPSVISSYYEDAASDSFSDGWFRTGDLGYQDGEGYVYIHGRLRDVINRGGENIAPREIEEVLEAHPSVAEAGVIGRLDRLFGEQVVAYIIPNEPWSPELDRSLHDYASENLSAHKVPVEFNPIDKLPRNEMGKLQHHRLQEFDAARHQPAVPEAMD